MVDEPLSGIKLSDVEEDMSETTNGSTSEIPLPDENSDKANMHYDLKLCSKIDEQEKVGRPGKPFKPFLDPMNLSFRRKGSSPSQKGREPSSHSLMPGIGSIDARWKPDQFEFFGRKKSLIIEISDDEIGSEVSVSQQSMMRVSSLVDREINSKSSIEDQPHSRFLARRKRSETKGISAVVAQPVCAVQERNVLGDFTWSALADISDSDQSSRPSRPSQGKEKSTRDRIKDRLRDSVKNKRTIKYDKAVEVLPEVRCHKVIDGNNLVVEWKPKSLPENIHSLAQRYVEKKNRGNSAHPEKHEMSEAGYFPHKSGEIYRRMRVRLFSSFSPVRKQKHAAKSKELLEKLVVNEKLELKIHGKDEHDRALADCVITANNLNVAHELVRLGAAWMNVSNVQTHTVWELQKTAKENSIGLWTEKNPTPPWVRRK